MAVWAIELDSVDPSGTVTCLHSSYIITDYTKHVTDAAQFSTNCESFGSFDVGA